MKDSPAKQLLKAGSRTVEVLASPLLVASALYLKMLRSVGMWRIPVSRDLLSRLGMFPMRDHYFEPFVNAHNLDGLDRDRTLPGIEMNEGGQLDLLRKMQFREELLAIPSHVYGASAEPFGVNKYYYGGDADCYYSMIRLKKPKRIIEIGSGYSTLIAQRAVEKNMAENKNYSCSVTCVEPFANSWLEKTGVTVLRKKVEDIDLDLFRSMEPNDILFIDSTHVIRPQGDVQFEYLQLLPVLRSGVLIHVHDIFTPKDYPHDWMLNEFRFFNEQYLVEAFLSFNKSFRIVAALHYLYHTHFDELQRAFPHLEKVAASVRQRAPGSFWMEVV